jgi:hypothetical protein
MSPAWYYSTIPLCQRGHRAPQGNLPSLDLALREAQELGPGPVAPQPVAGNPPGDSSLSY